MSVEFGVVGAVSAAPHVGAMIPLLTVVGQRLAERADLVHLHEIFIRVGKTVISVI